MKSAFLILFLLMSCGESPLFNHKNESENPAGTFFPVQSAMTFKKAKFQFDLDWSENPQLGVNEFELKIWSISRGTSQGPFEDPQGELVIYLWMPKMGHGSSPVEIKKNNKGEYKVSSVSFIMKGVWEVHFQLKKNGKVYDKAVVTYHL